MGKSYYTGKGIGVCILDTGIYEHIDFAGRIWAFYDFLSYKRLPYDDNGHGTHVAGLLAGNGTASMGKYRGAAPGCGIISLKVLDRYGNGSQEDVLRAFRWIREYRQQYRIRVVNISVGTTCNSKKDHTELIEKVEQLWDEGMVVVTAAGNQGPRPGSITAPGNSRKVITVGSQRYAGRSQWDFRKRSYQRMRVQAGHCSSRKSSIHVLYSRKTVLNL